MKQYLTLLLIITLLVSCKNDTKESDATLSQEEKQRINNTMEDGTTLLRGEFIYLDSAAVLTASNNIYAVKIDDALLELDEQAQQFKKSKFDMVNVVLRGEIVPNPLHVAPDDGWKEMVVIKEVMDVSAVRNKSVLAPQPVQ